MHRTLGLVLAAGLLASALSAAAAEAPPLDDATVVRRLEFLEARLEAGRRPAQLWQRGWPAFYAASTFVSTALALEATSPEERAGQVVNAAQSGLGLLDMLVLEQIDAQYGIDPLRTLPAGTPAERRARLAAAEALLRRNAARAESRHDWLRHSLGAAVALAGGLVLGLGYDEWPDAAVSTSVSLAVSEINIWTEPARAVDDLAAYERLVRGSSQKSPDVRDESRAPSFRFVGAPAGIALRMGF